MADATRRPLYHDYQPPRLYQTGVTLRRAHGTGPVDEVEEELKAKLLATEDKEAD